MIGDPQLQIIGRVAGTAIERLGHRTLETQRRQNVLERTGATPWAGLAFLNGWANHADVHSSSHRKGAYRRLSDGTVELRGLLVKTGNWTVGQAVAALPLGFIPYGTAAEMLIAWGQNGAGAEDGVRLEVDEDGELTIRYTVLSNPVEWLNLNGLRFSTV